MLVYAGAWPGSGTLCSRSPESLRVLSLPVALLASRWDSRIISWGFRDVLTAAQVQCGHVVGALQIRLGGANCLHQSLGHRAAQARFPWGSIG